jgi:hypothetical protein
MVCEPKLEINAEVQVASLSLLCRPLVFLFSVSGAGERTETCLACFAARDCWGLDRGGGPEARNQRVPEGTGGAHVCGPPKGAPACRRALPGGGAQQL